MSIVLLLLFSSWCQLLYDRTSCSLLLMALSPTAPIVSKHIVLFTWHYCHSHSLCLDTDYCTTWAIVLWSINTAPCRHWDAIILWLCPSLSNLYHLAASTGYGPCPQQLIQDINFTRNSSHCVLLFCLSSLLVVSWTHHCLCWGLTCLARGMRQTQVWEKHPEPSPSLHISLYLV